MPLVVATFSSHPLTVIAPNKAPGLLTTYDERTEYMRSLGVDVLFTPAFTSEVMNTSPEEYVHQLVKRFHPTDVVCGYNHTFGVMGKGKPELLEEMGKQLGFLCWVIPKVEYVDQEISSSLIRKCLANGEVYAAMRFLKRPYSLSAICEKHTVCFAQDGKQRVGQGTYRVVLHTGKNSVPAVLKISVEGGAVCSVPFDGPAEITFLAEIE